MFFLDIQGAASQFLFYLLARYFKFKVVPKAKLGKFFLIFRIRNLMKDVLQWLEILIYDTALFK
jgi:hypothetical protein